MTILFAAATVLINTPGASPVLTQDQVWAGMELKRKEPQLFLAVIDTCEVLEDDGETVVREVKFKDGRLPLNFCSFRTLKLKLLGGGSGAAPIIGVKVQEKITHIKPLTSTAGSGLETFNTIGGASRVLNIISTGATPDELYLTYTFEWEHAEIETGSKEAIAKQKEYQATAPKALAGTLIAIRKLVTEGKL